MDKTNLGRIDVEIEMRRFNVAERSGDGERKNQ
jgi:hypothetical protein